MSIMRILGGKIYIEKERWMDEWKNERIKDGLIDETSRQAKL